MITRALAFPLLNTEKALRCIFTLLRPGGTLAIWYYGPLFFVDPTLAAKGQPALYTAVDHAFEPVVGGCATQQMASWKRAADGMASWLDYITFSKDEWQDVCRQKCTFGARKFSQRETIWAAFVANSSYDSVEGPGEKSLS